MSANVALSTPCGTNGCGCWPDAESTIRNISTVGTNGNNGTLLSLEVDTIIVDEEVSDFNYCTAQFFVDTAPWFPNPSAVPVLVYRLRPVCQPDKYLDVSGGNVVLTDLPCQNSTHNVPDCESSFNFIPDLNPSGHYSFLIRYSSSSPSGSQYLSTNAANVVVANSLSWFQLDIPPDPPCEVDVLQHTARIESNTDPTSCPTTSRIWRKEIREECKKDKKQPRKFWKRISCFQ